MSDDDFDALYAVASLFGVPASAILASIDKTLANLKTMVGPDGFVHARLPADTRDWRGLYGRAVSLSWTPADEEC